MVVLLQLYRLVVILTSEANLYVDEAYYFLWAQSLEWGYYSKPPVIGWVIWLTTNLFGDSEVGVKIGSIFLYPLTTWAVYLIAKELYDEKIAFYTGLMFITLPSVSFSSVIISTDVVLLLFWAWTLLFFFKAVESGERRHWLLAGLFAGLGMLSKYNMVLFLPAALMVLTFHRPYRRHFRSPYLYLAIMLALAIFLPNVWWNYEHGFASFQHTKDISQLENRELIHPNRLGDFLAGQFLVFGPVFFGVLLYLTARWKKFFVQDLGYRNLAIFALFFLGFISTLALLSEANLNWAAPAYIGATVLVSAFLLRKNLAWLLHLSIGLHLVLMASFYHFRTIAPALGVELKWGNDPYKRVLGWDKLGESVQSVWKKYPEAILLGDSRTDLSEMIYYIQPRPFGRHDYWNPDDSLLNHFELFSKMDERIGKDFLYVTRKKTPEGVEGYFDSIHPVKTIEIPMYQNFTRIYSIYLLKGFKGY